jgi:glycosyltransferase involved in cell wall biosynthesis
MSNITIVITIFDPQEKYREFLTDALSSIKMQTTKPFEVLISGNSKPCYLEEVILQFNKSYPIRFLINDSTSTTTNLNFIIPFVGSQITKILFMDDFFIHKNALEIVERKFNNSKVNWLASGSKNFDNDSRKFVRTIRPKVSKSIIRGVNTIGCPSVIAFRTDTFLKFNENTAWMLDCEWYLRMLHHHGKPKIIFRSQIASRLHPGQATHWEKNKHMEETKLVASLHDYSVARSLRKRFQKKCKCLSLEL